MEQGPAHFLSESLMRLARQIRQYCANFPAVTADRADPEAREAYRRFIVASRRLSEQMSMLLEMARNLRSLPMLNIEQFEAEVECIHDLLGQHLENQVVEN